ncbi:uncharacterized protein LOC122076171 [Macadamia integrifolia]|uniref:uncharacterized protein LOC122076171 n=1 Tax=Macadamia integrifolia TaxID=60698 RepID=UPI001C4FE6A5|nr:uncharacterized protein LOC122076171 [Macadamia integrifolia]
MESNLNRRRRLPHTSGFVMCSSCLPIHKKYSRVPLLEYNGCSKIHQKTLNKWQILIRRLARKWTDGYGPKLLTFKYDADSYARNFDEGLRSEEQEPTTRVLDGAFQVENHKFAHEPI